MSTMPSPSRLLLLGLLAAAPLSPVHADEADAINFVAAVGAMYDDNLFRAPSGNGRSPQSDTIYTTTLGVDFNRRFSRQEIVASVSVVDNRYQSHSYLDGTAFNYNAAWLWAAGSHLNGQLVASRTETPNSFSEFPEIRNNGQRNLRVTETQRFALEYAFHPSWRVIGDINHQTINNEQVIFADADIETTGAGAGIKYAPASGNWLSWQVREYDGRYTKRQFNTVLRFDDEFTQPGHEFGLNWQLSGHSTITGRLEYLHRKHAHFSERNYSGWAGQLSYLYQYSAKTTLNVSYLRLLNTYQDQLSSYYVGNGINVGARWAATEKVTLGTHVEYVRRQYRGEVAPLAPGQEQRSDNSTNGGVDLSYKPVRWLEIKAALMAERRSSNDSIWNFTDRRALFSANALF